jgi:hypothetical protein
MKIASQERFGARPRQSGVAPLKGLAVRYN